MALGLPQTNTVDTGNQAVAQVAIDELISSSLALGMVLLRLFRVENIFNFKTTNLVAEDTKKSFDNQAMQTLMRAIGGGVSGLFTIGDAAAGAISESQSNKALAGDQTEIDTMKSYMQEAQNVAGKRTTELTNLAADEPGDRAQKERMERLTKKSDYSDLEPIVKDKAHSDRDIIDASDETEAQALADHLEELIGKKQDAMTSKRNANNRKGDNLNLVVRSAGMIGDSAFQGASAHYQQVAGKYESDKAVGQSALATIQANQNDFNSQANEALRTAIQSSEINVSIAQGDNLSNS